MDEETKLRLVREWLAYLAEHEPSEFRRMVECFRMQMGLPPIPPQVTPKITGGNERTLPGTGFLKKFTAKAG